MTSRAIDLRSDTVTRPDSAMRRAMADAEVGDDVYGEDPTARRLEEEAAAVAGMEAALFVPTGTMGNQIALNVHGRPGSEVLCSERCHLVEYEMGGMAALSGLLARTLPTRDGLPDPEQVEVAIAPPIDFRAGTGVLALENTHMAAGGRAFGRARLDPLLAVARRRGVPVHLDGARLFNAAAALDTTVAALGHGFDSLMFCLSKGLGAPVGSLLCGGRDFIAEARRVRKRFGGGMRQVGVLAAAGLVALRDGPARLAGDHANARWLAEALADLPGVELNPSTVETNIVVFAVPSGSAELIAALDRRGVLGWAIDERRVRFVTHRDVSQGEVEEAARQVAAALGT
jgi:threonine aldolase